MKNFYKKEEVLKKKYKEKIKNLEKRIGQLECSHTVWRYDNLSCGYRRTCLLCDKKEQLSERQYFEGRMDQDTQRLEATRAEYKEYLRRTS